ncbi:MAG TPA: hypothetical protein VLE89_03040, partial [Chlamydiales bacterium]|nr:hypothetical protein [Chlamydiales bacterium]
NVALTTGAVAITATVNGNLSFSGTINGAEPLTLTTSGIGFTSFGGNVGTGVALTSLLVNGATVLTGDTSMVTTSTIQFTGTIDGSYIGSKSGHFNNLVLTAPTSVSLGGNVGGVAPVGSLMITTGAMTLSNDIFTNNSAIDLSGITTLTLGANALISTQNAFNSGAVSGANITLGTTVTNVANMHDLNLDAGSAGGITISGTIGSGGTPIGGINWTANTITMNQKVFSGGANGGTFLHTGDFTVNADLKVSGGPLNDLGPGTTIFNAQISTDPQPITFNNPVVLGVDMTINSCPGDIGMSTVTFKNTVNGAHSLTICTGTTTFVGVVGGTTPLTSLSVNVGAGGSILIGASQTVSSSMTMNGPVTLTAPVALTNTGAGAMLFDFTVTGNFPFYVSGGGNITFSGAIDTSAAAGTGENGGDISIYSSNGTISVAAITASGANGVAFGGRGGDIILQPSSFYTVTGSGNVPDGKLVLNGNINTIGGAGAIASHDGRSGSVEFSSQGRAALMNIASITSPSDFSDFNLTVNCGTFIMGFNEAMTIFGNITINAGSAYATLSDMVSTGTIAITTNAVDVTRELTALLVTRTSGTIIDNAGNPYTTNNIHVLANTAVTFTAAFTPNNLGLNVGTTPVTKPQLIHNADILNYDVASTPVPPCPPCICNSCCAPCPSCNSCCRVPIPAPTSVIVAQLLNAGAGQLQNMLPLFWPPSHLVRIPKICLLTLLVECEEPVLQFLAFIFENDVH